MNWKSKIFLGLAGIGFLACMYQGATGMLFWIPDEEGEFQPIRSALAGLFAAYGGVALIIFIDEATRDKALLRVLKEQIAFESAIHEANSLSKLFSLKSKFETKIETLKDIISSDSEEYPIRIERFQLRSFSELLKFTEIRIAAHQACRKRQEK